MANENMSEWSTDFNIVRETVLIAMEQLRKDIENKGDINRAPGPTPTVSEISNYLGAF